jgi:hypothetical protein
VKPTTVPEKDSQKLLQSEQNSIRHEVTFRLLPRIVSLRKGVASAMRAPLSFAFLLPALERTVATTDLFKLGERDFQNFSRHGKYSFVLAVLRKAHTYISSECNTIGLPQGER